MNPKLLSAACCIALFAGCISPEGSPDDTDTNTNTSINHPPIVTPSASVNNSTVSFNASASDQDGDVLTYLWDFKDGNTSTDASAVHNFTQSDVEQTIMVSLTVLDGKGGSVFKSVPIVIPAKPLVKTIPSATPSVQISATGLAAFTAQAFDADGDVLTYLWDFKDGTTDITENPSHQYTLLDNAQSLNVTLIVSDEDDNEVNANVTVNIPAKAVVNNNTVPQVNPTVSVANSGIASFSANASDLDGDILTYLWTFGDGSTSIEQNPLHQYAKQAQVSSYSVSLVVTDEDNNNISKTVPVTISAQEVVNSAPTVEPIAQQSSLTDTTLTMNFSAGATDADNDNLTYVWDFKDGGSATTATPSHDFTRLDAASTVAVTVSVSDSVNPAVTKTINVTVPAKEAPQITDVTLTIEENTIGYCGVNGVIANNHVGAVGDGFADSANSNGAAMGWAIDVSAAGTYDIEFRYANGGAAARTAQVSANGSNQSISFAADANNWAAWKTQSVDLALTAGTNYITLTSTTADGLANIDSVTVSGMIMGDAQLNEAACTSMYFVPSNNFVTNGDVESGTVNWANRGAATVTQTTAQKHGGNNSLYVTGRTATWHGASFAAGNLENNSEYDVAVWVKLAAGSPDAQIHLTAKRMDDTDDTTYLEYSNVDTQTVTANEWTLLHGLYTPVDETNFQQFIIESANDTVSYYVDDFTVGGTPGVAPPPSNNGFYIGNITTNGAIRNDFLQYWNQLSLENGGKWDAVEPTRDNYNWTKSDEAYQFTRANGIPYKHHTFVWGSQAPNWIGNLSPNEQAAEIEELIRDFCTRYPDVEQIDVVNEATPGHAPAEFARNAFGNDWIIKSFQLARQYCPNSELILNDYNVLSWDTDKFITMARPAVNSGYVDAIGLQSHGLETWSLSDLTSKLNQIAALGLPIYISEYDIGSTNDQTQLNIMKEQFPMFYNHPSVKGITLWGYVSGATWITGSGLMSSNGTPRPALTWLMDYLENNPK
ncbi:endo-1,4-beta-xylanase [Marinicellulosiphila megalodicopiae]|uniref:endo-1,4-beta-xylanase n=1 Tax=Marinicellulosiphila megalodicopiae TaxID=2724896 RepID=UPI003BB18CC7